MNRTEIEATLRTLITARAATEQAKRDADYAIHLATKSHDQSVEALAGLDAAIAILQRAHGEAK
jgi:hypothetical protein